MFFYKILTKNKIWELNYDYLNEFIFFNISIIFSNSKCVSLDSNTLF